ncbi:Thymidylate synthase 2 [bacterium AB1]|nr:Thymidylate synthase 2 [bacterium AB1]
MIIITEKQKKILLQAQQKLQNDKNINDYESKYLLLCIDVLLNGNDKNIRGVNVKSLFCETIKKINIKQIENNKGVLKILFPLLTHRKVGIINLVKEVIKILNGDTDVRDMQKVWGGNTNKEFLQKRKLDNIIDPGFLGPMYGYQIRHFNAPFVKIDENTMAYIKQNKLGYDQLNNLILSIKKNPHTRTLLMTTFNPEQVQSGCLYPCTGIIMQYECNETDINNIMYQRSADLLIGVPYNVLMYSLITAIIGHLTNKKTQYTNIVLGDVHIYENHIPLFIQMIENYKIHKSAILEIDLQNINSINDLNKLTTNNFKIIDYFYEKPITYIMEVGENYIKK